MPRVSMMGLITQTRLLIGDSAEMVTDDEIQNVMDTHRQEARYQLLKKLVSYESGIAVYKTWQAPCGYWERSVMLSDAAHNELTPVTEDWLTGQWEFATSQTAVYLTGWTYDLYMSAADLLEVMAGRCASEYDFTADGASFHRSQKAEAYRRLAAEYRKKQQVKTVSQIREDVSYVD